ncbi:MAG TPA: GNAT family N-acetyltransferase [Thermoanaerobaculia bacterium]|nr:GNAT family N-acetyltransferase [Thermoanaerobaculia bacterium]
MTTRYTLPVISGDRLPTIDTPRLRLRWLTADDVPALFEIFGHPEVMAYWSSPPLENMAAAEALLADIHGYFQAKTLFQWGIARREDDRVIGTCTLHALSAGHRRAELGYAIARAEWGKGYGSEAAGALVGYAFDVLDLHRLEADVDPRNHASIRCLERLGFRKEGYARERYHLYGTVHDAVLYGLLRHERPPG